MDEMRGDAGVDPHDHNRDVLPFREKRMVMIAIRDDGCCDRDEN